MKEYLEVGMFLKDTKGNIEIIVDIFFAIYENMFKYGIFSISGRYEYVIDEKQLLEEKNYEILEIATDYKFKNVVWRKE